MKGKKIMAGAVGGALAIVVIWALETLSTVVVPGTVGTAIGSIASVLVSLATPDSLEHDDAA